MLAADSVACDTCGAIPGARASAVVMEAADCGADGNSGRAGYLWSAAAPRWAFTPRRTTQQ
jgi:hypothetical protein